MVRLENSLCREEVDPGSLRYMFRYNIIGKNTQNVIDDILTKMGEEKKGWPGHKFSATSAEGQALLGTPNVS